MQLILTIVAVTTPFAAELTERLRTLVLRRQQARPYLLDHPGERKGHIQPTPHLGGVAVSLSTLAAVSGGLFISQIAIHFKVGILIIVSGAIAMLGLMDDLRQPFGPLARLTLEAIGASIVVFVIGMPLLSGILAVVWIVVITNSFNLLDNSDGAMGTVAIVTATGLAIYAGAQGRIELALLLSALAASLGGFLLHNWHPAQIFLGDCGSLFTGFVLSSGSVLLHSTEPLDRAASALLAFCLVATVDTALVITSRRRARKSVFLGGRDHTAHRLQLLGLSVPGSAALLGLVALLGVAVALLIDFLHVPPYAFLPVALAVIVAMARLLGIPAYDGDSMIVRTMR
ncbi:MraY family glycosyltransferase [Streptomyces sioyaensis]|uniref:MraY family glycosyltransferase n=1 Tax=Streptomyces sioyaensis TaxID=67364 RepID=UPI0033E92CE2